MGMKKMYVLVLMLGLLPVTIGFAQTNKGSTLLAASSQISFLPYEEGLPLSGLLGFSFGNIKVKSDEGEENGTDIKMRSFNTSPRFGYFIVDNLALGADLNFSSVNMKTNFEEFEYEYSAESTVSLIGFGPFARYYFPRGKMYPFVEAGALFGQVKCEEKWEGSFEDGEDVEKTSVSGFNAGAGVGLPLGEKVVLDMILGYQSLTFKEKEDNPENVRWVAGTFGLKVGFVVFLGKD